MRIDRQGSRNVRSDATQGRSAEGVAWPSQHLQGMRVQSSPRSGPVAMPSEALAGIAGSRGVEGAATARLQQPHATPAQQQQKKDAGDESPDMGPEGHARLFRADRECAGELQE